MSGVFISYRRADSQGWAGRLSEDLKIAFGDVPHYFDLLSIRAGADFQEDIERALSSADAVLVLIGPRWITLTDSNGVRRLDDPHDLVAAEVSLSLARQIPVIPVLLGGADMPTVHALPEKLRDLARRNAIELSDSRWEYDRARLFDALENATSLRRTAAVQPLADVSVGADLTLQNVELGNVIGVRGVQATGHVDVLKGASMTNTKMGDIVGVESVTTPARPRP